MTVAELIRELEKFPPSTKKIGWQLNRFSGEPEFYETPVKINDDGTIGIL